MRLRLRNVDILGAIIFLREYVKTLYYEVLTPGRGIRICDNLRGTTIFFFFERVRRHRSFCARFPRRSNIGRQANICSFTSVLQIAPLNCKLVHVHTYSCRLLQGFSRNWSVQFVIDFSATIGDIVCPLCIKATETLRSRVVLLYFKVAKARGFRGWMKNWD